MTDREAYIVLNLLSGIGPARLDALLALSPDAAGIFELPESELLRVPGIGEALAWKIRHWQTEVDLGRELQLVERGKVDLIVRPDAAYPTLLKTIHDAPICLYVRGKLPESAEPHSLAMVGTRNASHYGEVMARHFAEGAAFAGWVTVSGLAVGIDTIVHRATVQAGGKTVAVLGGGLARLHPQENLGLARDIIEKGGAVISEFPMTFSPTRHTFPMRNRIISGLSQATLVIEAGLNSGSLITAAHAVEQGRNVFAVPGNADSNQSRGCNELIRKGAVLVETFEHVLQEFDFLPGFNGIVPNLLREDSVLPEAGLLLTDANTETPESPTDAVSPISFGPAADAVLEALKKGDATIDSLANVTGFPANELMSAVTALEIVCSIQRNQDGTFRRLR